MVMFWRLIEILFIAAIVLIAFTEFFIPILYNKPLFGSFRKKAFDAPKPEEKPLKEKISEAEDLVDETKAVVDSVKKEAEKQLKNAEELKDKTDNLL